jgi:hypothetical protein
MRVRVTRKVVLGVAFGSGLILGGMYVAYATAHDLIDRFDQAVRRYQ